MFETIKKKIYYFFHGDAETFNPNYVVIDKDPERFYAANVSLITSKSWKPKYFYGEAQSIEALKARMLEIIQEKYDLTFINRELYNKLPIYYKIKLMERRYRMKDYTHKDYVIDFLETVNLSFDDIQEIIQKNELKKQQERELKKQQRKKEVNLKWNLKNFKSLKPISTD